VDPHRFDGLILKLSRSLSRRSLVGGTIGASVLTAVGLGAETLAKSNKNRVGAEACIPSGKRCPALKPRGRSGKGNKKPKKLSCNQCCEGRSITVTDSKGKQVRKCGCLQNFTPCTVETDCCSNVCANGFCQAAPCAGLGQACNEVPGGPAGLPCCASTGTTSFGFDPVCNQATATTSGTCAPCIPQGGTCNLALPFARQCCGANFCVPSGAAPSVGVCGPVF
jgi:hypothetical protein